MKFSELLQHHSDRTGISKTEIANKIGKKKAYISNLTSGSRPPAPDTCVKIADALGLAGENRKEFLETAYIERNKGRDSGYVDAIRGSDYYESILRDLPGAVPVEEVPLIEWSAIPPPDTSKGGIMKYALEIKNSEMENEFVKGDIIHVESGIKASDGDFVIARTASGDAVLRLLRKFGNQKVLLPLNRKYPEIILKENPHDIIGVVIEKLKVYKRK